MSKLPLYLLCAVLVAAAAVVTAESIQSLPADAGPDARGVTVQLEDGSIKTVGVDAKPDESLDQVKGKVPGVPLGWAKDGAPPQTPAPEQPSSPRRSPRSLRRRPTPRPARQLSPGSRRSQPRPQHQRHRSPQPRRRPRAPPRLPPRHRRPVRSLNPPPRRAWGSASPLPSRPASPSSRSRPAIVAAPSAPPAGTAAVAREPPRPRRRRTPGCVMVMVRRRCRIRGLWMRCRGRRLGRGCRIS